MIIVTGTISGCGGGILLRYFNQVRERPILSPYVLCFGCLVDL